MDNIGRGWSFPPHFNKFRQSVEMTTTDQEEVEQSLKVLFSTHLNERLFHGDFGCTLDSYKFNSVPAKRIKKALEEAINEYESRITLNALEIDTENMLEGKLVLRISYTIDQTGSSYNLVYPYNFE